MSPDCYTKERLEFLVVSKTFYFEDYDNKELSQFINDLNNYEIEEYYNTKKIEFNYEYCEDFSGANSIELLFIKYETQEEFIKRKLDESNKNEEKK